MARKVCPVTLFSAYCSSYSSVREMVSGTLLQLGAKALPPGQKEHEGMCVHSHLSLGLACHPCSMWAAQEVGKRAMPRSNARAGREPKQRWDPGSPPHSSWGACPGAQSTTGDSQEGTQYLSIL